MRDFKGIKRQRNRNRNGGGGGGKPQHNANRAFDSNGPDGVKVRGAAQHVYEKYQQLARDAHTAGDRVLAENHLQHAEHYFRVMRAMQPQRPLADIVGRDQFVSGYDIDFEDEAGQAEAAEADGESAEGDTERTDPRDDRGYRDTRPRDEWRGDDRFDRSQSDRGQNDRSQNDRGFQSDRGQSDRSQNDRGSDRQFRGPRDDRFRDNRGGRDERPRFERQDRPDNRPERGEARPASPYRAEGAEYRQPAVEPEPGPVLRADDGEVSHAPAFLQARAPENEPAGEARRPRRRRSPREDVETPGPGTEES
jgi:hypothetical protein